MPPRRQPGEEDNGREERGTSTRADSSIGPHLIAIADEIAHPWRREHHRSQLHNSPSSSLSLFPSPFCRFLLSSIFFARFEAILSFFRPLDSKEKTKFTDYKSLFIARIALALVKANFFSNTYR